MRATDAGQGVGLVGGAWAGPAALCCLPARLLVGACGTGPTALGLARLLPVVRGMACRAQQQRCGPMGGGEYECVRVGTTDSFSQQKKRNDRLVCVCGVGVSGRLFCTGTGLDCTVTRAQNTENRTEPKLPKSKYSVPCLVSSF